MKGVFSLIICLSLYLKSNAQQPAGKFVQDSTSIGQPIEYLLEFSHKEEQDVLFPDSTFNYGKFLFMNKTALPTLSKNGISLDRAKYTLISFELENYQKLSLPVFLINGKDSTEKRSNTDSIFIKQQITASDLSNLKPKELVVYTPLNKRFNKIKIALIAFGVFMLVLILINIFKKEIDHHVFKLKKEISHRQFLRQYKKYQKAILNNEKANEGLNLWKQYLEKIDEKPYTSLSSNEIYKELNDQRLLEALREIDSVIYGNKVSGSAQFAFILLGEIAEKQFKINKNKAK